MAKYFFMYQCRPGTEAEYVERHKQVWPGVVQALKNAGFSNFITFMKGNQLYATIDNDGDFRTAWAKFQADPETQRWEKYMSEILITDVTQGEMEVIDNVVFRMD
ncbi:L-rhamnose mutarotase [Paenibacillus montanisoli]|uniref:L-rhamnose mutarotase n=1 Tax=Paenibacillus montanisoli TaxID=2081970 RepID=UPI001402C624|nr:L-rhamnose mutarotase [Paenibacillus montanisoli]